MALYLVQPRFFFPLFQFLWLQGQTVVLDCRKGQQNFCRSPPCPSGVFHPCSSPAQPSFANGIADCQFLWLFGASVVQRDHGFSLINIFHSVVEIAHIITFVRKKGTLPDGKDLVAGREDIFCGRSICHICRGRQFIRRQSGNSVYQHVAFVAPVELIAALIVLIGDGMDAQGAVCVTAGIFGSNLSAAKDFGLFCLVFAITGVESSPIKDASTTPSS